MFELSSALESKLVILAKQASQNAYCPYSKFRVGAAILTESGRMLAGCNVENASYGLTVCAERNAVFQMVAGVTWDPDGMGSTSSAPLRSTAERILAVVIYTPTSIPAAPCGACRQVLNEFGPTASLISVCDGPDRIDTTVDALLPGAFGPHNLA